MLLNLVRPSSLLARELRLVRPKRSNFHLKSSRQNNESGVMPPATSAPPSKSSSRLFLFSLAGLTGASLAYYHLVLDSKEQRRVNIMLGGCVRAVRSFRTGAAIGIDYKWSLWGLEEVCSSFRKLISSHPIQINFHQS